MKYIHSLSSENIVELNDDDLKDLRKGETLKGFGIIVKKKKPPMSYKGRLVDNMSRSELIDTITELCQIHFVWERKNEC